MKKHRSLNTTWYGLVILITVVPMIILLSWIGYMAHSLLLKDAILVEKQFNDEIKSNINMELNRIITLLQNKSDPIGFTLNRSLNENLIKTLFEAVFSRESMISTLSLISRENHVFLSMDSNGTVLKGTETNKRYQGIENKLLNYEHLFSVAPPEIVIPLHSRKYVSAPIFKDNSASFLIGIPVGPLSRPIAVLVASVNTDELWKNIQPILLRSGITTYLVDSHGILLHTPSLSGVHTGKRLTRMNIVRTLISDKEWDSTVQYTGINGGRVFGVGSYVDSLNWGVISEISRQKITGPIYKNLLTVAVIILLIAFLTGGVGLLFVNRLLRPFGSLTKAFDRVSNGNYSTRIASSSVKEIDNIVDGFNRMTQDINQRKDEIRNTEGRLQAITDNTTAVIYLKDLQGRYIFINNRYEDIFQVSKKEAYGKIDYDLFSREMADDFYTNDLKVIESGKPMEFEETIHQDDGLHIYISLKFLVFDSKNIANGVCSISTDITERKRDENLLKESEERLKQAQEIGHIGSWHWKIKTGKLLWSDEIFRILGLSPGEVEPSYELFIDFVHTDDKELLKKAVDSSLNEKSPYNVECRIIRKDGSIRVANAQGEVRYDEEGKPEVMYGFFQDITEHKHVERKLKELNESLEDRVIERTAEVTKLSRAVEHSSSTIVITDTEGNIEYVNPRFTQTTGYTSEEAIGENPRILKSGEQSSEFYRDLWSTLTSGMDWKGEFHNKKKNGELYWEFASISPIKDKDGVITNFIAVKENTTDRKRMEEELRTLNVSLEQRVSRRTAELAKTNEELRNSKEILTKAQRIARMGNWVWDISTNSIGWSDEIYYIFGLKPQSFDATYDKFMNFVHSDDKEIVRKAINDAIHESIPYNIEHRIVLADDTERIVHEQAEVIFDENGKPFKMIGTLQDITDLKKREEELIKAQKLDAIGILAGGIAHDFNNYLQGIMGYILLAQASADDGVKKLLKEAEKLIFQSKNLSLGLITFSKGGDPIRKTISISKLIKDSVSLAMSASRFNCQIAVPDSLWPVDADKGQLGQVFSNIVINAKQAMSNGGKVETFAENIEIGKSELFSLKEGKYVKITIKDCGTGISHKDIQKIFDPYFTTKKSGNGLGLSTCFSIIKKHGGHISVESEPGVGTTFYIYLPASMPTVDKAQEPVAINIESTENASNEIKGKILVMDDEKTYRTVIGEHLKRLEYDVGLAEDGNAAISLYKKALKINRPFDAVVMDLMVPGGMGGKETVKKLLKIDPDAKAVITSCYVNDTTMSEYKKFGFRSALSKPYEVAELDETLQRVIADN